MYLKFMLFIKCAIKSEFMILVMRRFFTFYFYYFFIDLLGSGVVKAFLLLPQQSYPALEALLLAYKNL